MFIDKVENIAFDDCLGIYNHGNGTMNKEYNVRVCIDIIKSHTLYSDTGNAELKTIDCIHE